MIFLARHWKKIVIGLSALAVAGTIFAGYKFVGGLVADLAAANQRLGVMETAIAVQDDTIEAQRDAIADWKEAQEALETKLEELNNVSLQAQQEAQELRRFFADADLSSMEDAALEALVNSTDQRSRCLLSKASGASGLDCSGAD